MGTRADFYVGRGADAEWLGSIAWDGYPDGLTGEDRGYVGIPQATTEAEYRERVALLFERRPDATLAERGWPWPWDTSHTTDYAYAFDGGTVYGSSFGDEWWPAADEPEGWDEENQAEIDRVRMPADAFPNMAARRNTRWDEGSGLIIVTAPKPRP